MSIRHATTTTACHGPRTRRTLAATATAAKVTLPALSLILALAWLGAGAAAAEPLRDPTRWPDAALTPAPAQAASGGSHAGDDGTTPAQPAAWQHRMVIQGRPYLVERGWLRGVGDQLGNARIERITETEVWLREGGSLRRQPLYPQVQILPAQETASASPASGPRRTAPRPPRHAVPALGATHQDAAP